MNCRGGACRVPQGRRAGGAAEMGNSEYIFFWMNGCSHCHTIKQRLRYCLDCIDVQQVEVSDMTPRQQVLFDRYNTARTVPVLFVMTNGKLQIYHGEQILDALSV